MGPGEVCRRRGLGVRILCLMKPGASIGPDRVELADHLIESGRVDFTSMGMSVALPLIKDGRLTALAVSTPKRSRTLPDPIRIYSTPAAILLRPSRT
ncbi:hypothetical protein B4Q13_21135 [Lacticaseibacillus rhamnosus]